MKSSFSCSEVDPVKHFYKVKFSLEQARKTQRGSRDIALLFLDLEARWGWVVNATSLPIYPGKEKQYPLCGRLGGPQGLSGQVRNISSPLGF